MELLAPAGNYNQALVSIENGCNALYGGLKEWSARNRAINLSLEEYEKLIRICKKNNVKFYLTLNTLLFNDELNQIKKVFRDHKISFPDGILAADIGLIEFFRNEFPEISIHASTQAGAYSLSDIQFLENLGIRRVVLARELTFSEIEQLRSKTSVELEVFLYGNQCVIYSGNCLWGGLVQLGSGNRGRCIGMCSDIFRTNNGNIGNFLWSNSIGIYEYVKKLEEIGIDSIKIEGRVRSLAETKDVVKNFRSVLDGQRLPNLYGYGGYIAGKIPPDGLFTTVNNEITGEKIDIEYTDADILISKDQFGKKYCDYKSKDDKEYVFTKFKEEIVPNSNNIRLKLGIEKKEGVLALSFIDYVNTDGERNIFTCNAFKEIDTVQDIYTKLKEGITCSIYECHSDYPALSRINYSIEWINEVITSINSTLQNSRVTPQNHMTFDKTNNNEIIRINRFFEMEKLYKNGLCRFVYELRVPDDFEKVLAFEKKSRCKIIYKLPYLDFNNKLDCYLEKLEGKDIMISRLSQLSYQKKYAFRTIYADYSLNVWNSDSAEFLEKCGVNVIVAHPEVPIEQTEVIEKESSVKMIPIGGGKIPIGYTRACYKNTGMCENKCYESKIKFENMSKGGFVEFVCDNEFGYRTILHDCCFVSDDSNVLEDRIWFCSYMSDNEMFIFNQVSGKKNEGYRINRSECSRMN